MTCKMNKLRVSVNEDTIAITEAYSIEFTYAATSQDTNKREALMNQLQNLVKQYNEGNA